MRKTERKSLKRSWKAEGKVEKPRADNYGMLQSKTLKEMSARTKPAEVLVRK